jgi:hypothetical protein
MKETKLRKKTRKLVYKNLDSIYKASKGIASNWGTKTIPLETLKIIIDKSKPSINTSIKELDLFNINYCNMLDTLYKTCAEISRKMNSKNIPISEIKNGINIMKSAYEN